MMKHFNPTISVLLALVILFNAVLACNFGEKTEEKTNLFYHYYSIEPTSLLDTIDAGNVNVFSPITEEPPLVPPDQQISVPWTQADYLRIANALFQLARGDTLDGWQLNSMDFALGCEEFNAGFQDGNFRFFKIVKKNEHEARIVRIVNIDPRNKVVFMTENEYYPKWVDWSSIDLGQNQLSADEALRIADKAGGEEKRLSVENTCDISVSFSPSSVNYNGWWIHYSQGYETLFHVDIDPHTGEVVP